LAHKKENQLNRPAVLAYLKTISTQSDRGTFIAGQRMDQTSVRAYYRWHHEGATPDFFSFDTWLTRFEIHISDFLSFCHSEGYSPWAAGVPDWELA
jgi:hypothetical protein